MDGAKVLEGDDCDPMAGSWKEKVAGGSLEKTWCSENGGTVLRDKGEVKVHGGRKGGRG